MTPLKKIILWYETLSVETLPDIHHFYDQKAKFKDPFNEVAGIEAIQKIFDHMFETTGNPKFVFFDAIVQDNQAFLTWHFVFGLKGKQYTVKGGSHLRLNGDGLIVDHRDYWDAAEELWQKLPLIGTPVRWLRGKFAAG